MGQHYKIELTARAEEIYRDIHRAAKPHLDGGDSTNAHVKRLRILQEALHQVIPHKPFDKSRALAGDLSNIFRVKKGRVRVFYVGSSARCRIIVLWISVKPRKAGDKSAPYRVFSKMLDAGQFGDYL